jgi:hypothetical protein
VHRIQDDTKQHKDEELKAKTHNFRAECFANEARSRGLFRCLQKHAGQKV